jgi:hypothetical protein
MEGSEMEVNIGEVVSSVRAVDGDSLLAPKTLEKIVEAVLQAVREQEEHRARTRAERQISSGVRDELEGER